MQFPRSEAEIAKLAVAVAQGLEDAAQDFPAPPVPPSELRAKLDAVNAASNAAIAAESAFREHHALKDDVLEDLADSLKANLKYAEYAVRDEPTKLGRLGWGTRPDADGGARGPLGVSLSEFFKPFKQVVKPRTPRSR